MDPYRNLKRIGFDLSSIRLVRPCEEAAAISIAEAAKVRAAVEAAIVVS